MSEKTDIKPKKVRKKRKDNRIEKEYEEKIEIIDPITGEITVQRVKITRYKAVGEKLVGNKGLIEEEEIEYIYETDEDA